MSEYSTQLYTAARLITDAARANLLKKAVLSKHAEGDAIRAKLPVDLTMFLDCRVWRAMDKYLSDDPRIWDVYRDDNRAQFVACYDAGVFADIIADIKQNINVKAENSAVGAW